MKRGRAPVQRSIPGAFASRVLLVALIAIAPLTLATLAHASPPDPSWIQGIYDDADHDDVAAFLTSETGEVRAAPVEHPPMRLAAERVAPPTERAGSLVAVSATRSRAPPAS
jgi:hypothetical protein